MCFRDPFSVTDRRCLRLTAQPTGRARTTRAAAVVRGGHRVPWTLYPPESCWGWPSPAESRGVAQPALCRFKPPCPCLSAVHPAAPLTSLVFLARGFPPGPVPQGLPFRSQAVWPELGHSLLWGGAVFPDS